ncbi:MAG: DsrE family protein [Fidelibacterota bacterium]
MTTIILNDAPYGNERTYNGLRLALALARLKEKVQIFLIGDAVFCAQEHQQTPDGYYNIGRMIKSLLRRQCSVYT